MKETNLSHCCCCTHHPRVLTEGRTEAWDASWSASWAPFFVVVVVVGCQLGWLRLSLLLYTFSQGFWLKERTGAWDINAVVVWCQWGGCGCHTSSLFNCLQVSSWIKIRIKHTRKHETQMCLEASPFLWPPKQNPWALLLSLLSQCWAWCRHCRVVWCFKLLRAVSHEVQKFKSCDSIGRHCKADIEKAAQHNTTHPTIYKSILGLWPAGSAEPGLKITDQL